MIQRLRFTHLYLFDENYCIQAYSTLIPQATNTSFPSHNILSLHCCYRQSSCPARVVRLVKSKLHFKSILMMGSVLFSHSRHGSRILFAYSFRQCITGDLADWSCTDSTRTTFPAHVSSGGSRAFSTERVLHRRATLHWKPRSAVSVKEVYLGSLSQPSHLVMSWRRVSSVHMTRLDLNCLSRLQHWQSGPLLSCPYLSKGSTKRSITFL